MKFTPRPYQRDIISHIIIHARCAVWAGMGMGKTVSALTAVAEIQAHEHTRALVVAPLRVAKATWAQEAQKWDHLKHLRVSIVCGTKAERMAALKTDADIAVTNYEQLPFLVDLYGAKWPFRIVVCDESTRLKGFRLRGGTKRAKALAKVSKNLVSRFIELTGTPSPNGLEDLWGQMWFLDRGKRLGKSFSAFHQRWFQPARVSYDAFAVVWTPTASAEKEITKAVSDLCITRMPEDYFGVEQPVCSTVRAIMPESAQYAYQAMQKDFFVDFGNGVNVEAPSVAVKLNKLLQLTAGGLYDSDDEWHNMHDAKLDALQSVIEEAAGAPVLVAYQFKSDLARLKERFPKGRALDTDPKTIKDWNEGRIPVLFAHPASAGHGLNLQDGGHIIAFFSLGWNFEQYQQIIERIGPTRQMQAGHPRTVFVYHIIVPNTVDVMVLDCLTHKKSLQDAVLDYMKK